MFYLSSKSEAILWIKVTFYFHLQSLYEYFGDSLAHCLPLAETNYVFKATKKEALVSLGDENTGKSGEELLDDLMEQIKLQV